MKYKLALILLAISLAGCLKVEEYPDEPRISLKEFVTYADSARLTISFTDGDGDVGLSPGDTLPPFDLESGYYFNLYCEYFELQAGQWTMVPELAVPFYYRVPRVNPTGQNPALIGEMSVIMTPIYYVPGTGYDTCRFEVRMMDRSLKTSNAITTPSFIKPQ